MAKKPKSEPNLPLVSKQTAGGITGAVIGGMVAGPVGAIAGGVAGAMVGNSSAEGAEPVKKAVETVRLAGRRGAKAIKAVRDRKKSSRTAKKPTTGSIAKKSARAKKTLKPNAAAKKPRSNQISARKAKATKRQVKKKA